MSGATPNPRRAGLPELKDGQALDRLTERAERWARSYRHADDVERRERDFAERFEGEAADLARRSTGAARPFEPRDWVVAIVLWCLIGAVVWLFSVFAMSLDDTWRIVFAIFAALIAAIGVWQSYLEVTSERRAADRLAKKERWLLGVSRKAAERIFAERAATRGAGS